jgi:hypothetical protein
LTHAAFGQLIYQDLNFARFIQILRGFIIKIQTLQNMCKLHGCADCSGFILMVQAKHFRCQHGNDRRSKMPKNIKIEKSYIDLLEYIKSGLIYM